MLAAAQAALPAGVGLQVIEGYRRLSVQAKLFRAACEVLWSRHPRWTRERIREAANTWVAAPDIAASPPHATGGAVDLTLVTADGRPLDMTGPAGWNEVTAPMESPAVPPEARRHRDLLARALSGAGLTNYPGE
jgi:D-alanyl-D-alanine dipeptidase